MRVYLLQKDDLVYHREYVLKGFKSLDKAITEMNLTIEEYFRTHKDDNLYLRTVSDRNKHICRRSTENEFFDDERLVIFYIGSVEVV